jgi:hypothetical protein
MKASAWGGLVLAAILCRQAGPAFSAKVIDADSRAPVGNAWVVLARTECRGLAHCSTRCVEVHVGRTNDAGEFPVKGFNPQKMDRFYAYKAGYWGGTSQDDIYRLSSRPFAYPNTEKLDEVSARIYMLGRIAGFSACDDASFAQRRELIPFYKDMFAEAWKIAQLPEHRADAKPICREMLLMGTGRLYSGPSAPESDPREIAFFAETQPECNERIDFSERDNFFGLVQGRMTPDVGRILSGGLTPAIKVRRLNPALVTASKNRDFEMMRLLLSRGADPNFTGENEVSLVSQVLESPTFDPDATLRVADLLLNSGADPNWRDDSGLRPLHRVSKGTDGYAIPVLLNHGAEVNQRVTCNSCFDRGKRPLHFARSAGAAKFLIAAGAEVNAVDDNGATALHKVFSAGVARVLIENGADVNARSSNRWTPLMFALWGYEQKGLMRDPQLAASNREIAKLLVQHGAELEDALHYTADEAFKAELRMLADPNKK